MAFNTLYFLLIFLPISVLLYWVIPAKFKNIALILISVVFYAWGNPEYVLLLLFSIVFNYFSALELELYKGQDNKKAAKISMIVTVIVNLFVLGYFKYRGFLLDNLGALFGTKIAYKALPLPLGISFFTFSALSYVLDVYLDKAKAQKNFLKVTLYMLFFPKLISGPIVRFQDMEAQLDNRVLTVDQLGLGIQEFLTGLFKKVLLSDAIGVSFASLSAQSEMSVLTAVLGVIMYALQLYFDFSGYSDMAIGLSRLFGFSIAPNFDHPYCSKSVTEFWRRWHISLGNWFKNYVYIPMGGNRCSVSRQILNLSVVWFLTGLWHGASWTYILWGLFHLAIILVEKFIFGNSLEKIPSGLRVFFTNLLVFFGWIFFFSPTLGSAFHYIGQLFGSGHMGFADATTLYFLGSNWVLLLIGAIACTPVLKNAYDKMVTKGKPVFSYVFFGIYMLLLIFSIAALVSNTYSSFLYFQF